jgi:hypothetical protein
MAALPGTVVVGTAAAAIAEVSATPKRATRAAVMASRVGPRAVTSDPFRV